MEGFVTYVLVVIVGAAAALADMRLFAFYSFIVTLGFIFRIASQFWKLVTVANVVTNAKLRAIAEKVGVTDEDMDKIVAEEKAENPKEWKKFERDFRNL